VFGRGYTVPMQFVIGFPLPHHPLDVDFVTPEFVSEFAQVAEESGFAGAYLTEHPIPGDKWLAAGGHDALDPFVGLSFIAAASTSLRLLTNLTVLPYRNPFLLAKTVATIDRLSGGRLILGVGTGYLKPEYFAMGVDFEERNELFDESLEVCRRVWTGQSVTYEGRHFNARNNTALPTPAQDPVPVWIGGNSKLSRRRVAERAQGWMPMPNPQSFATARRSAVLETLDQLAEMLDYMHDHAKQVGRTEPIDVMYMSFEGGVPGEDDWDHTKHIADVRAQADLGVNHQAVNAVGSTRAEVLDMIRMYGDTVISALR
jgi:probable F420-dependent oxidoreductase